MIRIADPVRLKARIQFCKRPDPGLEKGRIRNRIKQYAWLNIQFQNQNGNVLYVQEVSTQYIK